MCLRDFLYITIHLLTEMNILTDFLDEYADIFDDHRMSRLATRIKLLFTAEIFPLSPLKAFLVWGRVVDTVNVLCQQLF